jgi:hypothetical protein
MSVQALVRRAGAAESAVHNLRLHPDPAMRYRNYQGIQRKMKALKNGNVSFSNKETVKNSEFALSNMKIGRSPSHLWLVAHSSPGRWRPRGTATSVLR